MEGAILCSLSPRLPSSTWRQRRAPLHIPSPGSLPLVVLKLTRYLGRPLHPICALVPPSAGSGWAAGPAKVSPFLRPSIRERRERCHQHSMRKARLSVMQVQRIAETVNRLPRSSPGRNSLFFFQVSSSPANGTCGLSPHAVAISPPGAGECVRDVYPSWEALKESSSYLFFGLLGDPWGGTGGLATRLRR